MRERSAGERASFRACLGWLAEQFVPHYDDLIAFHARSGVRDMIAEQLRADCASAHPTLLAKWTPSLKASSRAPSPTPGEPDHHPAPGYDADAIQPALRAAGRAVGLDSAGGCGKMRA